MSNYVAKFSMGLLLAVALPLNGNASQWGQWGLAGIVVGYTLWRDWHREKRMSQIIEKDHQWIRDTMLGVLERNAAVLRRISTRLLRSENRDG